MALITAILSSLTEKKSSIGVLMRMICGLCLVIVALKPVCNLDLSYLTEILDTYDESAIAAASMGTQLANDAQRQIIKAETEAYILDKASLYGVQLCVEVTLSDDAVPVPESVVVSGAVSPYARKSLQKLIADDLGIPKERQLWTG